MESLLHCRDSLDTTEKQTVKYPGNYACVITTMFYPCCCGEKACGRMLPQFIHNYPFNNPVYTLDMVQQIIDPQGLKIMFQVHLIFTSVISLKTLHYAIYMLLCLHLKTRCGNSYEITSILLHNDLLLQSKHKH